MCRVLIFANGQMENPELLGRFIGRKNCLVYCADGGADICLARGILPDAVIGDMDSISEIAKLRLQERGVPMYKYPVEKDQTDLELAIELAIKEKAEEIYLVSACGGRLDHLIANLMLCLKEDYQQLKFYVIDGHTQSVLLRGGETEKIDGQIGETVSLIPFTTDVKGVSTKGLKWALNNEDLSLGSSRTMSNVLVERTAEISLKQGILMVAHTIFDEPPEV